MSNPNAKRIAEIEEAIEYLYDNLSGCDWCCGGGNEDLAELEAELETLENSN